MPLEMTFRRVPEPNGDQISLVDEQFWPEITITVGLLEQADRRFLTYGDGLIVFHTIEGDATYGVTGPAPGRAVKAKLLQVTSPVARAASGQGEEQASAEGVQDG
jgi:hypothetical protein